MAVLVFSELHASEDSEQHTPPPSHSTWSSSLTEVQLVLAEAEIAVVDDEVVVSGDWTVVDVDDDVLAVDDVVPSSSPD